MRVLHVIPSLGRSSGGPAEVVRRIVPALRAIGVDVSLITTDKDLTDIDDDVAEMRATTVVRARTRRWTIAPGLIPQVWHGLQGADVVHVHSVHTFPTTVTLAMARLRGVPAVVQPHGALNSYHFDQRRAAKSLYFALLDRFGLGRTRFALYSSRVEMHDGEIALPRIPGRWLPLGVDADLLTAERIARETPTVLFLSRLARKKRVDILLEALARLDQDDLPWEAQIAGPIDRDLPYDPKALRDSLGLEKRVDFVGAVDARERLTLLRGADIFVLPSDDESFGMAVAEAMATGCAVVASRGVGAASDASESGGVRLVDRSVEDVADAIERLLRNKDERIALGAQGRTYAKANLDWESIALRLQTYYHEAIRGRAEPSNV